MDVYVEMGQGMFTYIVSMDIVRGELGHVCKDRGG